MRDILRTTILPQRVSHNIRHESQGSWGGSSAPTNLTDNHCEGPHPPTQVKGRAWCNEQERQPYEPKILKPLVCTRLTKASARPLGASYPVRDTSTKRTDAQPTPSVQPPRRQQAPAPKSRLNHGGFYAMQTGRRLPNQQSIRLRRISPGETSSSRATRNHQIENWGGRNEGRNSDLQRRDRAELPTTWDQPPGGS